MRQNFCAVWTQIPLPIAVCRLYFPAQARQKRRKIVRQLRLKRHSLTRTRMKKAQFPRVEALPGQPEGVAARAVNRVAHDRMAN